MWPGRESVLAPERLATCSASGENSAHVSPPARPPEPAGSATALPSGVAVHRPTGAVMRQPKLEARSWANEAGPPVPAPASSSRRRPMAATGSRCSTLSTSCRAW